MKSPVKTYNFNGKKLCAADMSLVKPEAVYGDSDDYICPMCGEHIPQTFIGNAEHICEKSRIDAVRAKQLGLRPSKFAQLIKAQTLAKFGGHLLDINSQTNPISHFHLRNPMAVAKAIQNKQIDPKIVRLSRTKGDWGL